MLLNPSARLGRYEVVCDLGSGGVSRARDIGRGGDVTLRILQRHFAAGPDRVPFDRTVSLSRLKHPSIAAVYGIERVEADVHLLVTEYVEGESLSHRIARGPMPQDEVMAIARQVANALEVAHAHDVTHCGLTPASIVIGANGVVKVLDFGLATLVEHGIVLPADNAACAGAGPGTPPYAPVGAVQSAIAGRVSYMSPEQTRGELPDKRTDIWSFGAVFFAMLTGRHLFADAADRSTSGAVEHDQVDWQALPPNLPRRVASLLRRCLENEPAARLSNFADVQFRLNRPARRLATGGKPARASSIALLDGFAAWIQRSPRVVRLLTGLGRRINPIVSLGRNKFVVLGADEVRETLVGGSDFELGPFGGPKMLMGPFLLGMDPRHQYEEERARLEQILTDLLDPLKTIAREEATTRAAALADAQSIDVVNDFAEPIVRRIARRFFGIEFPEVSETCVLAPANGEELLSQWVRKVGSVIATTSPAPFGLQLVAEACATEFRAYLDDEISLHAAHPDPDTVLGRLLILVNARGLPRERVLPNLAGLMLAGCTPLVKAITHVIDQTLRHLAAVPPQRDDQTLKRLLFEALRFNPPFPMVVRYCPFTKILGGGQARRQMPAGTELYVALIGALFDAEINDADHFLPERPADENSSLVFGWGQHHCLGRYVATAELVEMLRAFLGISGIAQFRRSRIRYDGPAAERFVITRRRP